MAEVEAVPAVNPKRELAALAVVAEGVLKLSKLVSCFALTASDATSDVFETGSFVVEGVDDKKLNTEAAGADEISEAGAPAIEAGDELNFNTGAAGAGEVSETGAAAVDAFMEEKLNAGATVVEEVSETNATAVEGVDDPKLNPDANGNEGAGIEVERLLVLEASEKVAVGLEEEIVPPLDEF